ncbi:hypothetical protein D5R40_32250 [Okeania hirsuta]|uniref:Uncharacterized protein n=1 Tax=Okeania hirsuta TaxID=1458930 RepID=A0A3N6P1T6_9CYAN|nr:hypothetical protein D5R40_32250 [Okeania hirsuta]
MPWKEESRNLEKFLGNQFPDWLGNLPLLAAPSNNHRPPKWADPLFGFVCVVDELLERSKGDLHEFLP